MQRMEPIICIFEGGIVSSNVIFEGTHQQLVARLMNLKTLSAIS